MAKDNYFAVGGALKLKGAKDAGVKKKKKKPKNKAIESAASKSTDVEKPKDSGTPEIDEEKKEENLTKAEPAPKSYKTEAELKFEAARKKRLEEKWKKEAPKTHQERVMEFNQKLSRLSEHHDMPRIGPG